MNLKGESMKNEHLPFHMIDHEQSLKTHNFNNKLNYWEEYLGKTIISPQCGLWIFALIFKVRSNKIDESKGRKS